MISACVHFPCCIHLCKQRLLFRAQSCKRALTDYASSAHLQRGHQLSDSTTSKCIRSESEPVMHLIIFMMQCSFPPAACLRYRTELFWRSEQLLHTTLDTPAGLKAATCCACCACTLGHEHARFSNPQPPPTSLSSYSSGNRALYSCRTPSLGHRDMNQERM